jgi:hypothetical protein
MITILCDIRQFSAKNGAFSLKNDVIRILQKIVSSVPGADFRTFFRGKLP